MRTVLQVVSCLLIAFGALAALLGLCALVWAWFTPNQPPPSLNEGPGLATVVGLFVLASGGTAVVIGAIMVSALRASRRLDETGSPEWQREHKRLW